MKLGCNSKLTNQLFFVVVKKGENQNYLVALIDHLQVCLRMKADEGSLRWQLKKRNGFIKIDRGGGKRGARIIDKCFLGGADAAKHGLTPAVSFWKEWYRSNFKAEFGYYLNCNDLKLPITFWLGVDWFSGNAMICIPKSKGRAHFMRMWKISDCVKSRRQEGCRSNTEG